MLLWWNSGEVLLDQQRYQDAIEKFDYVIEHENDKYALPLFYASFLGAQKILNLTHILRNDRLVATALVNKGVALLQWKQDPSAQDLIARALELDPGMW